MNRLELQELAEERLQDAEILFGASQWSGAYYLAGYAVECGLKACIARSINLHDYPDKELANKCYTHKIETLVEAAGLSGQRKEAVSENAALGIHWLIVKAWDEKSRYRKWTETKVRKLLTAVSDPANGVLPWIKVRW